MVFVLFWLIGAACIAMWANSWNRSWTFYMLTSLIISPFVMALVLLISGKMGKTCPQCAESVKPDALKCKHCGHEFKNVPQENIEIIA